MVAADQWQAAATKAGLFHAAWPRLRIYPGEWVELPDFSPQKPVKSGQSVGLDADSQGFTRYAVVWDGFIDIPKDGGYNFYLLDPDGARLMIDGREVAKTGPPFAQVCGSPGNAMRFAAGSLGLRAGKHTIHIEGLYSVSNQAPRLMWQAQAVRWSMCRRMFIRTKVPEATVVMYMALRATQDHKDSTVLAEPNLKDFVESLGRSWLRFG